MIAVLGLAVAALAGGPAPDPAQWADVMPRMALAGTPVTEPERQEMEPSTTSTAAPISPDEDGSGQPVEDHVGSTTTTTAPPDEALSPTAATGRPQVAAGSNQATETTTTTTTTIEPSGGPGSAEEQAFHAEVNALRSAQGLAPLGRHGGLDAEARAWARGMAESGALGHSDLARLLPPWSAVAENVAVGGSVGGIFGSLADSAAHRSNMLGDYTHIGVGAWVDGEGTIWTCHLFAR